MTFAITAVPTDEADALRRAIESGEVPADRVVLKEAGAPCRHCLQPGQVGEAMVLFTYQPFRGESPYAVPSPIFLHAESCARYPETAEIPDLVRAGGRAVRSYDADHRLVDGDVAPGTEVETLIDRMLDDERVDYLHVYSATAGCFTCRVDRR